eukprot:TRINITY_DN3292_c0_g1_i1.p1 TRINITY_DN3292_c0_g1~~TRINITY_DN3292_c0_g1_i1.p1  ORF type:complete len:284 (+),score=43.77 TRINITY_DN3292_c0_g1_i1:36-854(+)
MIKPLFVFLSICVCAFAEFRFASYNIRSCHSLHNVLDLPGTASAIVSLNVDFVGLQEVDNCTTRSGNIDQTAEIARLANYPYYVFAPQINFQGGQYGIALLSKYPLDSIAFLHYSQPNCSQPREGKVGAPNDDYCRGAVGARIHMPDQHDYWVATTHLTLSATQQSTEADEYVKFIASHSQSLPVVFGGDLNATPASITVQKILQSRYFATLVEMWQKCGDGSTGYTFPADYPTSKIDYLFSTESPVSSCVAEVPVSQASDHRPLKTRFTHA